MKSLLSITACVVLAIASFLMTGCKKYTDLPHPSSCQITKITGDLSYPTLDSFIITYNAKGKPATMTRSIVGTSIPDFLFHYDQKGRMTDFYGVYTGGTVFDTWHRYHFDTKNRIVSDTTYEFGFVGPNFTPLPLPGRPYLGVRNVSTYAYDNQGRIIQSTDTFGADIIRSTQYYTYNHDGNLVKIVSAAPDGTSTTQTFSYDDKINYHQTNEIWQFLDRDYSVNNSLPINIYNQYGLPASISLSGESSGHFATVFFSHATFEYSCK